MTGLNISTRTAKNFTDQPLFFLIISVISIGVLRGIAIPPFHNYDEYAHFVNIQTLDLSRCGAKEDCSNFLYSLIPEFVSNPQRGVFYFLPQAAIQFILPRDFDNGQRLVVARLFTSVILYVPLIIFSYLTLRELFPSYKRLAILTVGIVGLLPSFSDIMGGVNIDASAALIGSIIVYTSARLIKRGVTLGLLIVLGIEIYVGYTTKGTVWPIFLVVLFSLWLLLPNRYRKWSTGALTLASLLLCIFLVRPLSYGVANWFYFYPSRIPGKVFLPRQAIESQVVGRYSFETHGFKSENSVVVQYVSDDILRKLRGKTITFGVWARAENKSAKISLPQCRADEIVHPLDTLVSDHWEFFNLPFNVPVDAPYLRCVLSLSQGGEPVWYDGMVVVEGNVSRGQLPVYENSDASSVVWGDRQYINFLANPSAEQSWLQVTSSLGYPFPVNQRIVSLLSWQLTTPAWWALTRWSIVSFWATFGGEQPGLSSQQMTPLALITALAIAGVIWTLIVDLPRHQHYLKRAVSRRGFLLLLFTVLAIFSLIVYRADITPFRSVVFDFSSMRHASAGWTAISALLAMGLLRCVPRQYQRIFVASTIVALFVLNTHIFLRVQLPLYICSYSAPVAGGQTCMWILPLD